MLPDRTLERVVIRLFPQLQHARLLLSVSGGADSMAMLHFFFTQGYDVMAAHVQYGLRPEESKKEQKIAEDYCQSRGIPFLFLDARRQLRKNSSAIQEKARKIRYEWLEKMRKKYHRDFILTAHHMDDNAETLLMHLIRGSGLRGMAGISPENQRVVRPFLLVSKQTLLEYVQKNQVPFSEDSSNYQNIYFRNRIRNQLIPLMKKENPALTEHLGITSLYWQGFLQCWEKQREAYEKKFFKNLPDGKLLQIPEGSGWEEHFFWLCEWLGPLGFTMSQIINILLGYSHREGQEFYSKHYGIKLFGKGILIFKKPFAKATPANNDHRIENINGPWPEELKAELVKKASLPSRDVFTICIPTNKLIFPLYWRTIRPGDSFIPFGMKGSKKVNDFLKDIGVKGPMKQKARILENGDGKIIWVAPYRISEHFRINKEKKILSLKYAGTV